MKKLSFTLICVFISVLSFAQGNIFISAVINDTSVESSLNQIIEDIFQEHLITTGYNVRVSRDFGAFEKEREAELRYQNDAAVSIDEAIAPGNEMPVDQLCLISVDKLNKYYYFRAKVFDLETKKLYKTASDYITEDITDLPALQAVASKLVAKLGYNKEAAMALAKEFEEKQAQEEKKRNKLQEEYEKKRAKERAREKTKTRIKNVLEPKDKGYEFRFISCFNTTGLFGFGMNFQKSYFQIGFDASLADLPSDISSDNFYEDDLSYINEDFFLLNQTENFSENGKPLNIESEYINPMFQISISPGLNLKHFAIECGLGVFICENLKMTDKLTSSPYSYFHEQYEITNTTKSYFFARPTIVGYIPAGNKGISVSLGYNICPNATPLNGFVFGVGVCW